MATAGVEAICVWSATSRAGVDGLLAVLAEVRDMAPTATRMPIIPLIAEMRAANVVTIPGKVAQKDFRSFKTPGLSFLGRARG